MVRLATIVSAYTLHPEVFAVENRSDTEHYLDLGCCRLEMPADA
jgi:hypothetical protein